MMLSRCALACGAAILIAPGAAVAQGSPSTCTPASSMVRLAELPEASGLAVSRSTAGRLWSHNDSGPPILMAFDANGKPAGRLVAVYRFPRAAQPGAVSKLERVGKALDEKPGANARITDGAISRDGKWVVLRSKTALTFYPGADFLRGDFGGAKRVDLKAVGEPQGEGIAFGAGDTVYLAGEGGGKKQPGTLLALSCRP